VGLFVTKVQPAGGAVCETDLFKQMRSKGRYDGSEIFLRLSNSKNSLLHGAKEQKK